ncbi:hypothetical protein ABIB25_004753 [Nakamurella sp. UYEF19]|uniref:hypothetical protein n=1 Tax=Nakamurella sp. UYEF19 TaxID=1756392 RepID=UPI00339A3DC7
MTETAHSWAKLRQVVIATTEHYADTTAVRTAFGLGEGFADPELKKISLADATLPVSAERYLEIVGSTEEQGPVGKWLGKIGGRGGFVLSVQHPDPAGVRARAAELGVRVPIDELAFGKVILQLHPKDVGLVLEIDGIADPAEWFWDDINPGPEPGAAIDEILGVEVPVADPAAMNLLWHRLMDLGDPVESDLVDLSVAYVRFVPGGPSADWTVVLRTASSAAADPGLAGITFRLV